MRWPPDKAIGRRSPTPSRKAQQVCKKGIEVRTPLVLVPDGHMTWSASIVGYVESFYFRGPADVWIRRVIQHGHKPGELCACNYQDYYFKG